MEEPVHNDQFEDFLKKSFEKYTESPSDALWGKIEGDLGIQALPAKGFSVLHWIAGSAIVLVLGIAGYQHFAFKGQVQRLQDALINKEQEVKKINATAAEREMAFEALENKVEQIEKLISGSPAVSGERVPKTTGEKIRSTGTEKEKSSLTGSPLQTISNQSITIIEAQKAAPPTVNNSTSDIPASPGLTTSVLTAGLNIRVPAALPLRMLTRPANITRLPVMPLFQDIEKINYAGKWSLGGQITSMKTKAQVTDYEPVPDSPFPHNGDETRSFVDTVTATGNTLIAGISLKYQATPRFAITSGLNYRNTTMYATHEPPLKVQDGHHHGGPGGPGGPGGHGNEYDFSCQLNTAYGAIDIDLRAEQIDSSLQIDDNEPVALRIDAKNVRQSLTIPLIMSYRLGKNRFHVDLQGGLLANVLLSNRFEIEDIQFNDLHFKAPEVNDHKGAPKENICLSMDYLAGIGFGYDLTDALSLNITPVVSGSLYDRDNGTFKTSDFSAGLSTGISYRF